MKREIIFNLGAWLWNLSDVGYLPEYAEDYTAEDVENTKMSAEIINCCNRISNLLDA